MGASLLALAKSIYYCISQEEHPIKVWKKMWKFIYRSESKPIQV